MCYTGSRWRDRRRNRCIEQGQRVYTQAYRVLDCNTVMSVNQSSGEILTGRAAASRPAVIRRTWRRAAGLVLALVAVLLLAGGSALPATQQRRVGLTMTVAGWTFDLVSWEVEALSAKLQAALQRPAADLSQLEGTRLVRAYLDRAHHVADLERRVDELYAENGGLGNVDSERLQAELDALRAQQEADRLLVEQVLEWQISSVLAQTGFQALADGPFPPVQFTFVEPPKKLVVSPRERIDTIYYRMLRPELDTARKEVAEETIYDDFNLSAYITNVGGLGAYPSMVIDRASLEWILSTIAHEWVHNYLTLHPLGIRYGQNSEITTMNETVAEIVGNEIGAVALRTYYPDLAPPEPAIGSEIQTGPDPANDDADDDAIFDFRQEMRTTRLEVDRLLAAGKVEEAEAYMEARRQIFVANGYPIRKLNQAYFAFHGSYGTGAASTSPIGPKLEDLRSRMPDVHTFLTAVRGLTSPEELDALLTRWTASQP